MTREAKIEAAAREVIAAADALEARGSSHDIGPEIMRGQYAMVSLASAIALPVASTPPPATVESGRELEAWLADFLAAYDADKAYPVRKALAAIGPPPTSQASVVERIVAELRACARGHWAASRRDGIAPDVAAGHRYTDASIREAADEIERQHGGRS